MGHKVTPTIHERRAKATQTARGKQHHAKARGKSRQTQNLLKISELLTGVGLLGALVGAVLLRNNQEDVPALESNPTPVVVDAPLSVLASRLCPDLSADVFIEWVDDHNDSITEGQFDQIPTGTQIIVPEC